jgi:predicted DNA-binding mobile mystery protein A
MRTEDRAMARKNIDRRLAALKDPQTLGRPPRGWIKAIREALGMTSHQLAQRMGVSQPRISEIEKQEMASSLTLDTLQRAANALDCQLVYALVPRESLNTLVQKRAEKVARARVKAASHSMALEGQGVDNVDTAEQLDALIKKLTEQGGYALWDDR